MTALPSVSQRSPDAEHLKQVLDAMRYSQPLPHTHLKYLTAVQLLLEQIEPMGMSIATDIALIECINMTIHYELMFHRQHYELCVPETMSRRSEELVALRLDFQQQNIELEAWSLLYFRNVRLDLALDCDEIARIVGQTTRNLRRRQAHGIGRLLHCLLLEELRLKRKPK